MLFLIGQATLIPAAAIGGYFFGLQRNLPVTANALGSKVAASIGVVALSGTVGLVGLAAVVSVVTIAGNRGCSSPGGAHATRVRAASRVRAHQLVRLRSILRECAPISLWTLAAS